MNTSRLHKASKRRRQVDLKRLFLAVIAAVIVAGFSTFAGTGLVDAHDTNEVVMCKYYKSIEIESGETPQQALKREIKEELEAQIEVGELLHTVEYDYPTFHLTMHCFVCTLLDNTIHLNEHQAAKWLNSDTIDSVEWLPADVEVAEKVKKILV